MKRIYLDNAATTPLPPEVLEVMTPYFSHKFGNPSSVHSFGQESRSAVDHARETVAKFLNCRSTEVIFTSGGSEADNLALEGVVESLKSKVGSRKPHIITSAFEHHAVLETIKGLETDGKIEATYIKPSREGLVKVGEIEQAIKNNTVLVSVMYVNNEIGTVQPIREIGKMIEKVDKARIMNQELRIMDDPHGSSIKIHNSEKHPPRIYFHTDAVQAVGYFEMDVDYLHVDLLSMSAHKIYGPKGVGLLYVRTGTPLRHQIVGGGQEFRKRAGTENVAGIVGLGKAVEIVGRRQKVEGKRMQQLRDKLIDGLLKIPNSILNGSHEHRSPANANISFLNAEGESILLNLDMEGIAASTGSACTSGSLEPSHVLSSMGLPPKECHGSIRFTLGRDTTEIEIEKVLEILPPIVKKLREMSPFK